VTNDSLLLLGQEFFEFVHLGRGGALDALLFQVRAERCPALGRLRTLEDEPLPTFLPAEREAALGDKRSVGIAVGAIDLLFLRRERSAAGIETPIFNFLAGEVDVGSF
jgi:hypothetical protein